MSLYLVNREFVVADSIEQAISIYKEQACRHPDTVKRLGHVYMPRPEKTDGTSISNNSTD